MTKAELNTQVSAQPGMKEMKALIATLEQILEDSPRFGLEVCNRLFSSDYSSLKPGLIKFVGLPAAGAGDALVVELRVTDRFRELVAAAEAGDLNGLRIDE